MTDKTDQTAHLTHLMGIEVDRVDRFFGDAVAELERDGGSVRFFNAALIGRAMRATLEAEGPEALARAVQRFGDAAIIAANPKGRA